LPFCHRTVSALKYPNQKYPIELKTLGDHIRKRRLDLTLLQKQVGEQLGVDADTVFRWESNASSPSVARIPDIIDFLAYDPLPTPISLPERLLGIRKRLGLSQSGMARRLGIDPTTLRRWEHGRTRPNRQSRKLFRNSFSESTESIRHQSLPLMGREHEAGVA
jgi:DNA-binding transcriptional regulator YiaG